jgi:hypothetical protein
MISKLSEEIAYLKKDNAELKGQMKDLLGLVNGPIGPSGNESHNDQVDARALPLQPKSYKDAVVSRLQCQNVTTANNADVRSDVSSKLTPGNNADGATLRGLDP